MFADADFGGRKDRKSILGYVVVLGGGAVVGRSRKQKYLYFSRKRGLCSYWRMCEGVEMVKMFLSELDQARFIAQFTAILYFEMSALCLAKAEGVSDCFKHRDIGLCWHFIRDEVEKGGIIFKYVESAKTLADTFTKAVNGPRVKETSLELGLQHCTKCCQN